MTSVAKDSVILDLNVRWVLIQLHFQLFLHSYDNQAAQELLIITSVV